MGLLGRKLPELTDLLERISLPRIGLLRQTELALTRLLELTLLSVMDLPG